MSHTPSTRDLINKIHDEWCIANGYKPQAPSLERYKPQAASPKPKQQASSFKPQATSSMIRDPS